MAEIVGLRSANPTYQTARSLSEGAVSRSEGVAGMSS